MIYREIIDTVVVNGWITEGIKRFVNTKSIEKRDILVMEIGIWVEKVLKLALLEGLNKINLGSRASFLKSMKRITFIKRFQAYRDLQS